MTGLTQNIENKKLYLQKMDSDIEQIHNIVLDAHLPSSINDLKNPTEEYVVSLITAFLRRFQIDVSVIDKVRF